MAEQKGIDPNAIWQKYQDGVTQKRIALDFGISRTSVQWHIGQKKKAGASEQAHQPSPNPEETQGKTTKVYPASSLTL